MIIISNKQKYTFPPKIGDKKKKLFKWYHLLQLFTFDIYLCIDIYLILVVIIDK